MTGRRILALGGHEFDRRSGNDAICDLIVELAESPKPRICLLPTASGDPHHQIAAFRRSFGERACIPAVISLFRLGAEPLDVRAELMAQDAIYVGGGSLLNLIAIWRAHGIDEILRDCWNEGILLCGQSAGAMCWFEGGVTSSSGELAVASGLGLLPGSACVHYVSESSRRRLYLAAVARGELPPGLGLEDQVGALFEDRSLVQVVSAREGARAWKIGLARGEEAETPMTVRRLEHARQPINDTRAEVLEFRQTLATRAANRRVRRGSPGRLD